MQRLEGTPAVEVTGLRKSFRTGRGRPPVVAVDGLDLLVGHGEVVGLLGPNGAGKTTTVRLLLDLLRPDEGTARVLGHDPWRDGLAVRAATSSLPAELHVPERVTGAEVLDRVVRLRADVSAGDGGGARRAGEHGRADAARRRGQEVAERLGLDLGRRVAALSTGNRRKLGVVLALAPATRLLVLDEPTSGLDPVVQQEFAALVREAAREGRTVLLSSHVLPEVQQVADRVVMVRAGRLVASGTVAELTASAARRLTLRTRSPVPADVLAALPGVVEASVHAGAHDVDARVVGPPGPLLAALARLDDSVGLDDVTLQEPDLQDAFLHLYAGAGPADASTGGASPLAPCAS